MGRGSSGTRSTRPRNSVGKAGESAAEKREKTYSALLDAIESGDDWGREAARLWEDMDDEQRYLALMEGGFSGLVSDDELELGTLYYAADKGELLSRFEEDCVNASDSKYGIDDSTTYTIGYKDGSIKRLSEYENDYTLKLSGRQSYSTQGKMARSAARASQIDWIIRSDGYSQPQFYARNDSALESLKKAGGFERWRKGRGEKRRSYIQDDWV